MGGGICALVLDFEVGGNRAGVDVGVLVITVNGVTAGVTVEVNGSGSGGSVAGSR